MLLPLACVLMLSGLGSIFSTFLGAVGGLLQESGTVEKITRTIVRIFVPNWGTAAKIRRMSQRKSSTMSSKGRDKALLIATQWSSKTLLKKSAAGASPTKEPATRPVGIEMVERTLESAVSSTAGAGAGDGGTDDLSRTLKLALASHAESVV
jgi:hypothetical protein